MTYKNSLKNIDSIINFASPLEGNLVLFEFNEVGEFNVFTYNDTKDEELVNKIRELNINEIAYATIFYNHDRHSLCYYDSLVQYEYCYLLSKLVRSNMNPIIDKNFLQSQFQKLNSLTKNK